MLSGKEKEKLPLLMNTNGKPEINDSDCNS